MCFACMPRNWCAMFQKFGSLVGPPTQGPKSLVTWWFQTRSQPDAHASIQPRPPLSLMHDTCRHAPLGGGGKAPTHGSMYCHAVCCISGLVDFHSNPGAPRAHPHKLLLHHAECLERRPAPGACRPWPSLRCRRVGVALLLASQHLDTRRGGCVRWGGNRQQ